MKKKVEIEENICDFCNRDRVGNYNCLACKRDCCYDCKKIQFIEFKDSYFTTADAVFCKECHAQGRMGEFKRFSPESRDLFLKYIELKEAINQIDSFWAPMKIKCDSLAKEISKLKDLVRSTK